MFKNWSKSTLINISCSLFVYKLDYCIFRHLKQFGYTLRYHIIIFFFRFCSSLFFSTSCVYPGILCTIRCSVQKCNNVRLVWTSRFLSTEQPWPQYIYLKIRGRDLLEKAQELSGWFEAKSDWCMHELEWNRALVTTALSVARRRLHACIRATGDIFNIHRDIN